MTAYTYGVIAGVLVGVLLAVVIWAIARKKHGSRHQYDERQIIGQGKAYKAGFFTLMIYEALCICAEMSDLLPGDSSIWHAVGVVLSIGVFAITAIHYDAYIGMNETPSKYYRMGICFFGAMVCIGISNIHRKTDFAAAMAVFNLMIAALWLVIVAALMIHQARKKKTEDDEE